MVRFTVYGKPLSVNDLYHTSRRQGRRFLSSEGKAYKKGVADCAMLAMNGAPPLEGDLRVTLTFYFQSRRNDWDGPIKPTTDAMQGIVYPNDSAVMEGHVYKRKDKDRPRVEILVEPIT